MKRILWILLAFALLSCSPSPAGPRPLVVASPLSGAVPTDIQPASPSAAAPVVTDARVAYVKDGNIWSWTAGQAPLQLTDSGQDALPQLSSDGQVVIFLRESRLWAVNADGTNPRQLETLEASLGVTHFYLLPQNHVVYFTTQVQGGGIPEPNYDLYVVDADNPSARELLKPGEGGQVTFSPDGRKMALGQPARVNVANIDGSGLITALTFQPVSTYSEWQYIPQVVWLSNSYGFKTVIPAPDPLGDPSAPSRFLFVPAEGGPAAQLALFQAAPVAKGYFPFLSPDSDKVAYLREQGDNLELHVVDTSTADKLWFSYAKDKFGLFGWAGDGQSLVTWMEDHRKIYLHTPDGKATPLGDTTYAAQVAWLNGTTCLFLNENELRLRTLGQPSILIDSGNISFMSGIVVP